MSEHDEQRPMTRRERRLREMGQSPETQPVEILQPDPEMETEPTPTSEPAPAPQTEQTQVEISPYNEDGSLRTRAEMRALRAQADQAAPAAAEPDPEPTPQPEPEPAVDDVPPTQPFTIGDLIEAEAGAEETPFEEVVDPTAQPTESMQPEPAEADPVEPEPAPDPEPEPAEPKPKRFGWRRSKRAEAAAAAEAEVAEPAVETEAVADAQHVETPKAAEEIEEADVEVDVIEAAPAEEPAVDVAPIFDEIPEAEPVTDADAQPQASEKTEYSFPDIQPPEEWRSVFDDPVSRSVGDSNEKGDFDSLIERAVAQEGSAGSSNTAALIMPSSHDDTGGLTGPLGATGDLFVTGSIELPKSLAETGGHSEIHDSIKLTPVVPRAATELPSPPAAADGPTPMAAKSAVSARMSSSEPLVGAPRKDSSKLPLILTLTGGGMLIVVAGIGVWAWQSGVFG